MLQFRLVGGRHHHEAGQGGKECRVERARMRRAVGADETGAVDREAHRQALDRDVVDDLVVGALQEGGIERGERLVALGGKAGGEGHRMLFGDADIETAGREDFGELVEAGAVRHGGGDADDLVVELRFLHQRFGEDARIARRIRLYLGLRAGDDVELVDAVILVGGGFGGRIALALLRDDMDQHRALPHCRARCAAREAGARRNDRRSDRYGRSPSPRTWCRR